MSSSIQVQNIVLVGFFNPSFFDKHFMIKNQIIKEEEIVSVPFIGDFGGTIVTSSILNIAVNQFQIIVTESTPTNNRNSIVAAVQKLIPLIDNCITAIGLNLHYVVPTENSTIHKMTKKYFYSDSISLFSKFFNDEDCAYGVYCSREFKQSRLKLDVKPIITQQYVLGTGETRPVNEGVAFIFNFHVDVIEKTDIVKNKNEIMSCINDYEEYQFFCSDIMSIYN